MAKLLDGTRIYGSANIDNSLIVNTMNIVPTITSSFLQANNANIYAFGAHQTANSAQVQANAAFLQANNANIYAFGAHQTANSAQVQANAAFLQANNANIYSFGAHRTANSAQVHANAAFLQANNANIYAFGAHQTANSAQVQANAAFLQANNANIYAFGAHVTANAAFGVANQVGGAVSTANGALAAANTNMVMKTGNTMTGNLVMSGANIAFSTNSNAGIYWGGSGLSFIYSPNSNVLVFGTSSSEDMRLDSSGVLTIYNGITVSGTNIAPTLTFAYTHANAAFLQANNANIYAFGAHQTANSAQVHANAAFLQANNANIYAFGAHRTANSAQVHANAAFLQANNANIYAFGAHQTANSAQIHANAAFTKANLAAPIASPTFTGTVTSPSPLILLKVSDPSEGGEITFEKSSGSNLSGNLTLDLFSNVVRIFESTGTNRGFFLDVTKANTGVGGEILHTNNWFNFISTSGGTSSNSIVYYSDSPPTGVANGTLWWQSNTGSLFIRYGDGDSSQWVATQQQGLGGSATFSQPAANSIAQSPTQLLVSANGLTYTSSTFVSSQDATVKQYMLIGTTTNATPTRLLHSGGNGLISVRSNTTIQYTIDIVARRTDAVDESAGWTLKGVIDNFSGTVADVGNLYEIIVAKDDANYLVDATANNTSKSLDVLVTGVVAKQIRWIAYVQTVEVSQ